MSGPRTSLPSMGLPSSPEHPQPLRVVAHAVRGYIDKLGPIWVEAQLIEINQGSRSRLVFLTMRDTLAEVSVSVSISPLTFDAAGPLTKGQTVVARLKPSYYATTGRLTFACDSITPSGEGRLLARLEQTKRLLQAEGLFDPALKKRLPFLPRAVGLVTGAAQRGRTRRRGERPASLAGGAHRHPARAGARSAGRRADHRARCSSWIGRTGSTSSSSPAAADRWRTCCRSPTKGWSERSSPAVRRWSAPSVTSRTARSSIWSPTYGPRPPPTPRSGWSRTWRRSWSGSARPANAWVRRSSGG